MQQKNVLIGAIVILVFLILGGYYFFFAKSQSKPQEQPEPIVEEETIPTIIPEDIGLEFTLRSDKKAAKFVINNAEGIESVEYQISYLKEVGGEEVPEGLIGEAKPKTSSNTISIDYREFGTCSSGVCRYDKVVSPVKLTVKITKTDGKVYSTEQTLTL